MSNGNQRTKEIKTYNESDYGCKEERKHKHFFCLALKIDLFLHFAFHLLTCIAYYNESIVPAQKVRLPRPRYVKMNMFWYGYSASFFDSIIFLFFFCFYVSCAHNIATYFHFVECVVFVIVFRFVIDVSLLHQYIYIFTREIPISVVFVWLLCKMIHTLCGILVRKNHWMDLSSLTVIRMHIVLWYGIQGRRF